jgi:glycosyltransferase involved in cell wall biosynthesis
MHIITPSRWLAECASQSNLMRNWDVTVVPNTLNTKRFMPINKKLARDILGLPNNIKLILFGAIHGTHTSYKGWDLLMPALTKLAKLLPNAEIVIFGQGEPKSSPTLGMPIHWMGHLHDDASLALLYSAADVAVVPSRQESFGQVASEAQACGCPVAAFNATGLRDVVEHKVTGYLAKPYCSDDLVSGIDWILANDDRHLLLSTQARIRALGLWSHDIVVPQYLNLYRRALATSQKII